MGFGVWDLGFGGLDRSLRLDVEIREMDAKEHGTRTFFTKPQAPKPAAAPPKNSRAPRRDWRYSLGFRV